MQPRNYHTNAIQPDERALALRARGVSKIRESGLSPDHRLMEPALGFIEGMPSACTTQIYGYNIGDWFGWCARQGIDPATATRFNAKAYLAGMYALAPMSRAQRMSSLRSFYEELVDEEKVARNPFRRVVPRGGAPVNPTPALSLEEFTRVLSLIRKEFGLPQKDLVARRDFAMVYLMGRLGLRRVEVQRLTWRDLRGSDKSRNVNVHGKGDKYADVHVPADVREVLEAWRETIAKAADAVPTPSTPMFPVLFKGQRFVDICLEPMAVITVGLRVKSRMFDAGLDGPRYAAHALRATAATLAHENGADLLTIARMLRHVNVRTTQGYIVAAKNRQSSAADVWIGPTFGLAS
jgi:integrase